VDHPYATPETNGWPSTLRPPSAFLHPQLHQAEGMVAVQLGVSLGEAVARLRIYAALIDQQLTDVACSVVERRLQLSSPTIVDAAGNVVMWDLGSGLGVSRQARGHLSALLTAWGLAGDHGDSALNVMNELIENAVEHGGGLLGVAVSRDGHAVKVSVLDGSTEPPTVRPRNPLAARGRGLQIVDALALSWGYFVHDFGKTVWASM
jgi:hypothetical protein